MTDSPVVVVMSPAAYFLWQALANNPFVYHIFITAIVFLIVFCMAFKLQTDIKQFDFARKVNAQYKGTARKFRVKTHALRIVVDICVLTATSAVAYLIW